MSVDLIPFLVLENVSLIKIGNKRQKLSNEWRKQELPERYFSASI